MRRAALSLLGALALAGCAGSAADTQAEEKLQGDQLVCYREASPYMLEWQRRAYLSLDERARGQFLLDRGIFRDREDLVFFFSHPVSNEIYTTLHPELPEPVRQGIVLRDPFPGMSKNQVLAAWGRPDRIVEEGMGGLAWVYEFGENDLCTLLFRNGYLEIRPPGRPR